MLNFFFFFGVWGSVIIPSHLRWPSLTASSGDSTKTIPPPLMDILRYRDGYLHYFGKDSERCAVKGRCLHSHVCVHHIRSQPHAIFFVFSRIISSYCDRSCRLLHGQPRQPFEWNYFPLLTERIVQFK